MQTIFGRDYTMQVAQLYPNLNFENGLLQVFLFACFDSWR